MKPTKEEILKSKFKNSFLDLDYLELYLEAMQEYAEQFHNEKMREELLAFQVWCEETVEVPADMIFCNEVVDKYLKTMQ
jgi:hypothetical protein